jgi:signal transduction protein with GAF and PtsI domain
MSVGGAEARHAAALAQALGVPPVPQAFEATDRAVAAGNGV